MYRNKHATSAISKQELEHANRQKDLYIRSALGHATKNQISPTKAYWLDIIASHTGAVLSCTMPLWKWHRPYLHNGLLQLQFQKDFTAWVQGQTQHSSQLQLLTLVCKLPHTQMENWLHWSYTGRKKRQLLLLHFLPQSSKITHAPKLKHRKIEVTPLKYSYSNLTLSRSAHFHSYS